MRRAVARGRVFPQSYSTDRRYGRLSLKACALFPLMWVNADDQGRLCGDPEEVKYACCPNIDHITKADIPQILGELEQNQLIKIYNTPKSAAIQILDWWNIQKPQWAWPSEYPPSEGWQDRLRYKKDAKTVITQNWSPSPESQKDTQVSEEKLSGEDTDKAHPRTKNYSPETQKHAQVNLLVSEDAPEKVLAGAGPLPSPPLETEKERETESGNRNSPETPKGSQVSVKNASGEKSRRHRLKTQDGVAAEIATLFEQEGFGKLTPFVADTIREFAGRYRGPPGWIRDAFREAVTHNHRNLAYVQAILERWQEKVRSNEQRESKGRTPAYKSDSLQDYAKRARNAGLTVIISGEEADEGNEDGGV